MFRWLDLKGNDGCDLRFTMKRATWSRHARARGRFQRVVSGAEQKAATRWSVTA